AAGGRGGGGPPRGPPPRPPPHVTARHGALMGRKNTLPRPEQAPAVPAPAQSSRPVAVVDMGASAIRLVVAEGASEGPLHLLEEVSRGVLLGKDTFTHGRLGAATIEATLKALEGFRRIMDTYGVI